MIHHMKLHPGPFSMIKSGLKTYELRLYDSKRQTLQPGHIIEFMNSENNLETIRARILALHVFDSFAQLYAALPLLQCGYTEETIATASPKDMEQYYSPEEQANCGVVAIELERIPQ